MNKKPLPEWLNQVRATMETDARAVAAKVGLDLDDPEVDAVLSEPCDFDTFNQRLDALIKKKQAQRS